MNMITYASPIALRPQRKYALGLYIQSMSWQNVRETGRGVLQVGVRVARCAALALENRDDLVAVWADPNLLTI